MSDDSLLKIFQKSYQNTDLTPLRESSELEEFWVEYGSNSLEELVQLVEDNGSRDAKIVFSGHRGCGKSTLLAEFGRRISDRYFVTFFSIAETIEMSDINHINILFAIAVNLMLTAEKERVNIPKSVKDEFYKWFAERTETRVETPINAQISVGFALLNLITGRLKTEAYIRNELKRTFERNITELIQKLNEIAASIQKSSQKEIIVIIDDLDKLDLAVVRGTFQEHIKALFLPGFNIIYTIPISSLRDISLSATLRTEADDQIVVMPVSKLIAKEERRKDTPTYQEPAIANLCEMLHKRIPEEILEPDIAKKMVIYSGGVVRELMRLCNQCCRICLRQIRRNPEQEELKVDSVVLGEAIKKLRQDFEITLGKQEYEILKKTYDNFLPDDPKEEAFLDLLHGLDILEYRNDEVWYDVHPIVTDLLQIKGQIDAHS
ncbi:AAA family ATPase [Roseofilum reptotaenium CS-1145]|uniref:AAA family ATPase n=1 Tax=Roseofilum reptotaenium AO1-A TaxID=1925591 RepID=A0A1L9QNJ3_9CYAN|nr:P-loop NTPase fold protein [Roseofilum reptotaenium]MDB9517567.1 AAA family ATPase [Roseofilum reptotaenium CS-1145]OJJ24258.1 AAA family ATPase [Roseofilum reptotaenium AO1-A]